MWIKHFTFNAFILTVLYLGQSTVFAAAEPVSIECPCSLERTFPTTWSLKFSIVFDREIDQTGGLEISISEVPTKDIYHADLYYQIASESLGTLDFSSTSTDLSIRHDFSKDDITIPFFIKALDVKISSSRAVIARTIVVS